MPFDDKGKYRSPNNKLSTWLNTKGYKKTTDQIWWLFGLQEGKEDIQDISYALRTDDDMEILWRVLELRWNRADKMKEAYQSEYRILLNNRPSMDKKKFIKETNKVQRMIDTYGQVCSEISATQRVIEVVFGYDVYYRAKHWYTGE
jgi:hypothetical protein